MQTLVHDPEAAQASEAAPADGAGSNGHGPDQAAPEAPAARACPTCGAALAPDQDWCLECGSGTRDRWGAMPGWRTAAAVIAVTLVMASGAVAAAYAALRSGDGSAAPPADTIAQTQADADAIPPPPPIDIPAETEAETQAAAEAAAPAPVEPPAATPPAAVPLPAPVAPVTPAPVAPVTPSTDSGAGAADGGNGAKPVQRAPLTAVELDPETTVAAAYNPFAHPDTVFAGEPGLAFDGDRATAWTVSLPTPTDVAAPAAGLVVDLGTATKLRRLTITPTTPGTTIEVYGTRAARPPATLDDDGWEQLATQLDVDGKTRITLGEDGVGTGKVRQLLIWFSEGPADGSAAVGIGELKLFK